MSDLATSVGAAGACPGLAVTEEQKVAKGDLLFGIDPVPFRLAVNQLRAEFGSPRRMRMPPPSSGRRA